MALKKPIASYNGEFTVLESGDAIDPTAGGTGLSSYTAGSYIRAADVDTLEERTPTQVRGDILAKTVTINETAPSSPSPGDEWVKPSVAKRYMWYEDGTSNQWIEMDSLTVSNASGAIPTYIQDTAPVSTSPFLWLQTGLGDDGQSFSFWFEDGL